ncbi:MAG: DUF2284 domain-containing protein [Clostridiaceae bacterium]|nr:DUF2284 domain-containing protein [Clostridiaceae bacterium]
MDNLISKMVQETIELGAYGAGAVEIDKIVFDRGFRSLCESNACGNFDKCWTCPPDAGDIDDLINKAKSFDGAIVYQTVRSLEDSYDFEGMMEAGSLHNVLAEKISAAFASHNFAEVLHLGAGGCHVCEVCTKRQDEPCRYPERAMASLETYGVAVSQLAETAGLKYINGQNTVTYFGAYFYKK